MGLQRFHTSGSAVLAAILALALPGIAEATAVTLGRTERATDFVAAGIGGIGSGPGNLVVTGVSGPVTKAFLYWHGIDNTGAGAVYDNPTVTFAGSPVTGVSLGDAETNCWGQGGSRAFFADVSERVAGNGSYSISGLNALSGHSGNGASLIVLFDDGNDTNDRDLVFFEGNDSSVIEFGTPGDANGWSAVLDGIAYAGGGVTAHLHVGDGQAFPDGPVSFIGESTVTVQDNTQLYDSKSTPNAGFSRALSDSLWDIHSFDITAAFGQPGTRSIQLSGMNTTGDCHSLVVLLLELGAGSAPCGNGTVDQGEECDPPAAGSGQCPGLQSCLGDCTCGCTNDFQCNDGNPCTFDQCDEGTGGCVYDHEENGKPCDDGATCTTPDTCLDGVCTGTSTCPTGPGCADTCDAFTDECRECGRPVRNDLCLLNAVFVLQCALELRSCEACTSDVDSSGEVTATDSLSILRGCAGLATSLDCPSPGATTTTTQP